jgi:hypothetical protein
MTKVGVLLLEQQIGIISPDALSASERGEISMVWDTTRTLQVPLGSLPAGILKPG